MTSYYNLSLIQEILLIHGGKDGGNSRTDTIFAYDGTSVVYVFVSQCPSPTASRTFYTLNLLAILSFTRRKTESLCRLLA